MIVWLLLIKVAGSVSVTPMPDMATCTAVVQQVKDGNARTPFGAVVMTDKNIKRAQCLDGSER